MALKRYSKKEPLIFVWVMIPCIAGMNMLVFGSCIFSSFGSFARALLCSGIYFSIIYFFFGLVATLIKRRFPSTGHLFKRMAIMLPLFYVMNIMAVSGLFFMYDKLPLVNCIANTDMLLWVVLYGCAMSTLITFINEAVANWEAWKTSLTETEKLKQLYQRSRVLGLKGQINPHFLFNCFNTLSGLIHENEEKAEQFLDEMTKVHRYLLRSDDELLVSLDAELKFAGSYLYLARERFGDAVKTVIDVPEHSLEKTLPPLSLHVILENIIYTNALEKTNPLTITITTEPGGRLSVTNTLHEKTVAQPYDASDDGFNNLLDKYKMLNAGEIEISVHDHKRTLLLPLFGKKEVAV